MVHPRTRRRLRLYVGVVVLSTLIGLAYGALYVLETHRPLVVTLAAAIYGCAFGSTLGAMEIFGVRTRLGRMIEQAPFLVTVGTKVLVYGLLIVIISFGDLGRLVGVPPAPPGVGALPLRTLIFSFAVTAAFIFVMRIGQLVGGRNLRNLVLGRYHSPRVEERFFLFVDVRGSTGIAERLGRPECIDSSTGCSDSRRNPSTNTEGEFISTWATRWWSPGRWRPGAPRLARWPVSSPSSERSMKQPRTSETSSA
jgi:adenylate cyclase